MKQPGSALFRRTAVLTVLASLGLFLPGCPPSSSTDKSNLTISANPASVAGDGTTTVAISVSGTDAKGKPLSGLVLVTTTKGTFPSGTKSVSATMSGGSYQTALTSCDTRKDKSCAGSATVTAASGALTASTGVTFECTPTGPGPEGSAAGDCYDGFDNDCNGTIDDADPGCVGKACDTKSDVWTKDPTTGAVTCSCPYSGKPENTVTDANGNPTGCLDGIDNDCNGLTDGQDPNCKDQVCNSQGWVWHTEPPASGLVCGCVATETVETTCDDGIDNDCKNGADCLDPNCVAAHATCKGPAGYACIDDPNNPGTGICACGNGTAPEGSTPGDCNDGIDNDCDGKTDCADPKCYNKSCGSYGLTCDAQCGTPGHPACGATSSCTCPGGQSKETTCNDNADNDCNGKIDCADPNCQKLNAPCGPNGETCSTAGTCVCAGSQTVETNCSDQVDNDCNGLTDCQDPSCDTLPCGTGKICQFSTGTCITDPGTDRLLLSGDKTTVLAETTSEIVLTAQVSNNAGPRAGVNVTFTVPQGQITESGSTVYVGTTDSTGTALAHWRPGATPGKDVTATATINTTGTVTKSYVVQVIGLASISVGSIQYSQMGINDSAQWQTQNNVQFVLKGTDGVNNNLALPDGVPVSFTVSNPSITLNVITATTVGGTVSVIATSGYTETQFTITATATIGVTTLSATTTSIPVIGRNPAYMTLSCPNKVNIGGLVNTNGSSSLVDQPINCTVTLYNRFNHPVPVPTQVTIQTEAGSVQSPVTTKASNGAATFTFNPKGSLPEDVTPFTTAGEPSWTDTSTTPPTTHNPRDGLVSIIAFTNGEERFFDSNGNGVLDPGEGFIDLAEPFVDNNDNSTWDNGEFTQDSNANGHWDGPNGVWDASTIIWTQTRVVETGDPAPDAVITGGPGSGFNPATLAIPLGGSLPTTLTLADINLNPMRSGTTVTLSKGSADKVNETFASGGTSKQLPDVLGATWSLLEDCGGTACTCATNVCTRHTTITGWTGGSIFTVNIADTTATGGTATPFTVTATYNGPNPPYTTSVTGTTGN